MPIIKGILTTTWVYIFLSDNTVKPFLYSADRDFSLQGYAEAAAEQNIQDRSRAVVLTELKQSLLVEKLW